MSRYHIYENLISILFLTSVTYILPLILLVTIFIRLRVYTIASLITLSNNNLYLKIVILLFFLNLAGIPPLPGFFFKLFIYSYLIPFTSGTATLLILVLFNFIMFYFYIKNLKITGNTKKLKTKKLSNLDITIMIISILVYILGIYCWFIF